MKKLLTQLEHFVINNTAWIFIMGVLFASNAVLHQYDEQRWGLYFWYIAKIGLAYLPLILFAGFRKHLQLHLKRIIYWGLWVFFFLGYPPLLFSIGADIWLAPSQLGEFIVSVMGVICLSAEVAIQLNRYFFRHKQKWGNWMKRIKLEQSLLLLIGLLAPAYIFIAWQSGAIEIGNPVLLRLLGYSFQMLALLLIYYCFYHINHYFLVSKLLKERGLIYYIFGFLGTLILLYPLAAQLIANLPMVQKTEIHPLNSVSVFNEINFVIPFMGMLLSIPFIMAIKWSRQASQLAALEREKSQTELSLLRQQINPHFFFNTLNNLYALSLKKDAETPEVILQLSELMRYVIYKGKEDKVALADEVKYLEDYIRLQQIRLHKKLDFHFDKSIDNGEIQVPPLLFVILVENAFKHGVEPAEGNCYLHLSLESDDEYIFFTCENSVEEQDDTPKGIGLINLQRRLDLLYPDQDVLSLSEAPGYYRAEMSIRKKAVWI